MIDPLRVIAGESKYQGEERLPRTHNVDHRGRSRPPEPGHWRCYQAVYPASSRAWVRFFLHSMLQEAPLSKFDTISAQFPQKHTSARAIWVGICTHFMAHTLHGGRLPPIFSLILDSQHTNNLNCFSNFSRTAAQRLAYAQSRHADTCTDHPAGAVRSSLLPLLPSNPSYLPVRLRAMQKSLFFFLPKTMQHAHVYRTPDGRVVHVCMYADVLANAHVPMHANLLGFRHGMRYIRQHNMGMPCSRNIQATTSVPMHAGTFTHTSVF